eukprot:gene3673-270_t
MLSDHDDSQVREDWRMLLSAGFEKHVVADADALNATQRSVSVVSPLTPLTDADSA